MTGLDQGVLVVGAGVAGLAAARHLRAHNIPTTLVEAAPRIGGRAWTTHLGPDPFDHGATWFHDAHRNPVANLARETLLPDDDAPEHLTIDGRPATPADHAAYEAAWSRLETLTPTQPDTTLAAALAHFAQDPWSPLIALWEGAIIAAADAHHLSLHDWHRNRLHGQNLIAPQGLGTYIAHHLATETHLDTPITEIDYTGPTLRARTPAGTITAAAAIITVSTGVLAADAIRFHPPLPTEVQTAIASLPMGLLTKIAVPNALPLAPNTRIADRNGRMTFIACPQSRNHLIGFIGGDLAWSVAHHPEAAADLARTELHRALGPIPRAEPLALTNWGTNPHTLGAYAYTTPGNAQARHTLAQAFPAQRLLFAGEATRTDGLAGTIAGAYLSGQQAANRLLAASTAPRTAAAASGRYRRH